jgi:dihydropteroate synthase
MGIVNVTPDSFSDGGRFQTVETALAQGYRLSDEGADVIDIGGESSRPGSEPVPLSEELQRILPVIEGLAASGRVPLSVDTTKADVARQVLNAGASIINDVTALGEGPEMARVVADAGAGLVLMHMQGVPRTMQQNPSYTDVVTEVYDFLAKRVELAEEYGISRERIAVDPGIGFGKTFHHNRELLRNLQRFADLGCAILVGTSRKRFLGTLTGRAVDERAVASAVSALAAATQGANVVRVHDVAATADAIKVWTALRGWG